MKKFLLLAWCLLAARTVYSAQIPIIAHDTGIIQSTWTIQSISTSTTLGATQADFNQLPGRAAIELQNLDATANLWCVVGSTAPAISGGGREILKGGGVWSVQILDITTLDGHPTTTQTQGFWCISDGASPTKLWTMQVK